MKKAFVYTTDINYCDEARVLTYSLQKHHPGVIIFLILCYRDWEHREYDKIQENFKGFTGVQIFTLPKGMSWNKQIKFRYKFACDLAIEGYDSICILDADMLCLHPMDKFFQIANSGVIVACSDNMLTKWSNAEIKHFFKQELPEPVNDIQERVSNVPWFFNPQERRVAKMLYEMDSWDDHDQCDYTLLNYFMFKHKIIDITLLTNSFQFTNIHHTMLKPDTFAKESHDRNGLQIYSEQGMRVYMIHGHWKDEAYLTGLMEPMIRNYSWHKKGIETAQNVVNMLKRVYNEYYDKAIPKA